MASLEPGNGTKSLYQDITATKERAASWVFRVMLAVIGASGSYILYQLTDEMKETRASVTSGYSQIWDRVGKLGDAVNDVHISVQSMTSKYDAQQSARDQQIQQMNGELSDHEARIRGIEAERRLH